MSTPTEGTLAWYLADLAARKAAFLNMLKDPRLSPEDREMWELRLAEVELVLADMAKDPVGYTAWLVAERNIVARKQTDRFPQ